MPDGYLILDQNGLVADSNTVAREVLVSAVPDLETSRDVRGRDVEDLVAAIEFHDGEEAPLDEGQFAVDRGGEERYVELQSTVLEDDGFFIGRLITFRDVTKKVLAERQLRRERREFETLFAHMRDPVTKVGFEAGGPTIEAVNPAFSSTFGVDRDAVTGRRLDEVIVPGGRRSVAADLYQRIQAGESVKREVRRQTDHGQRDFLLRSAPVEDDEARTLYLIYTDITDEKRRQRELERQNRRLQQFASIVSHDLRNPLNVAQGLLETAPDAEDPIDNVEEAARSLDRMEAMIEDVLTLARQGADVGEADPVRLDAIADTAWNNVDTEDASLSVADSTTMRADPDRLLQLLENLFRNSVEHAGEDVTVGVGTLPDRPGFYVADDGPGIPPDRRENVFDHGYTTNQDGTGFGLSIVDQIASAHGWDVTVTESTHGGARFEVTGVEVADDGPAGSDREDAPPES